MINKKPEQDYSKLARWLCLFEAVNIIADKADKIGQKNDCLKPIPINKYINERYPSVLKDVEYEFNNNHHKHHR
mgnify:CR=1 FL=1|tara:strand:- start:212 stop:433 length:222 start_codon:yes stop_codon:yes gene_type:complete